MIKQPLVVDLDGALIHSDMLHESVLRVFKDSPFETLRIPFLLAKGKAFLKQYLASCTEFDPKTLPYNKALLEWFKQQRVRCGRRTLTFEPAAAIKEITGTLRPGDVHVAFIPLVRKWERSQRRAVRHSDGTVEHRLPEQFHGNPVNDEGSLVVTDWDYDVAAFFPGMETVIFYIDDVDNGIRAEYIEIVVSQKSAV